MRQRSAKGLSLGSSSFLECRNQILSAHAAPMREDGVLGRVLARPCQLAMTQTVSRGDSLTPINVGRVEEREA